MKDFINLFRSILEDLFFEYSITEKVELTTCEYPTTDELSIYIPIKNDFNRLRVYEDIKDETYLGKKDV